MNRRILIIAGLALLVLPSLSIPRQLRCLSVLREGKEVPAVIRKMPGNCGKRHLKSGFMALGQEFSLRISQDFCRTHQAGDTVILLHSERYPELFVFPRSEKFHRLELLSCVALPLLGLVLLVRNRKPR